MRFQIPALAIGLFASLALSDDTPKVRIETDDATLNCVLRVEGLCDPDHRSPAATTTEQFATYNEDTKLCEFSPGPPEYEVCTDDEGSHDAVSFRENGDGTVVVVYEKTILGSGDQSGSASKVCDLKALAPDAECNLEDF